MTTRLFKRTTDTFRLYRSFLSPFLTDQVFLRMRVGMRDPVALHRKLNSMSLSPILDLGASYGSWISDGYSISCV